MEFLLILLGIGLIYYVIKIIFYVAKYSLIALWYLAEHIFGGLYCIVQGMIEGTFSTVTSVNKVFIRLIKEAVDSKGIIDYFSKFLIFKGIGYIYTARGNFIDGEKVAEKLRSTEYVDEEYGLGCFELGRGIVCGTIGALLGLGLGIISCMISFSLICIIYLVSYITYLPVGIYLGIKRYLQSIKFKDLRVTYQRLFGNYNWTDGLKSKLQNQMFPIQRSAIRFNTSLHKLVTEIVLFIFHIILFVAVLPINLPFFLITKLVYVLRRKMIKYSTVCPNCYEEMKTPSSICPQCSEIHESMWPHFKYVLYKKCTCGKRMWVDGWRRRKKVLGKCNHCGAKLLKMDYTPVHIPIIGSNQVGKTNFIYYALEDYHKTLDFDNSQIHSYTNNLKTIKTEAEYTTPSYKRRDHFNMYFKKIVGVASMVFLHELPSKSSLDSDQLSHIKWLNQSKGLIMLFKLDDETQKIEEILDVFLIYMHKFCALKPHQRIKKPCVFVLRVKGNQLSDRALSGEVLLQEMGHHNLLNKIQNKFKQYKFIIEPDYSWDKEQELTKRERENAFKWLLEKSR